MTNKNSNIAVVDPTRHFYAEKDLLIVAVDFDGVLVDSAYPKLGLPKHAYHELLKELKKNGWYIILWTCRSGNELAAAINYCLECKIPIDRVNDHHPEMMQRFDGKCSPKIHADVYIDDKNANGLASADDILAYCNSLQDQIQNGCTSK